MALTSKVHNMRERYQAWGLARSMYWEVMNLARRLFGLRLHYVRVGSDLKRPGEGTPPVAPDGYVTRIVGLDDLLPYVERDVDLSAEFLREAFSRGDECAANFYGDELVGFGFICRSRTRASEQFDVIIPQGFRYSYKDWTHEDHRRKHLSRLRGHVRFTTLSRPYEERSIWFTETHNYASLLHGYRHPRERSLAMGLCGWFTVFGRQIPFNSRRAKWIGFEIVRRTDDGRRQYR